MLNLLRTQLLNQFRFPDINTMKNIVQLQRSPSLHERLNAVTEIAIGLLFSLLMNGRAISHGGIISDLSHSHVEILQPLMMLKVPVRGIRSIRVQQNASLEYLDSFLPIKVVVTDECGDAALEILQPILMMTTVTTSLLVRVPIFSQFPDIVVIRSILRSYRRT
jgi:hypothetical protein